MDYIPLPNPRESQLSEEDASNVTPTLAEFVAYAIHYTKFEEGVIYTALGILHRLKYFYPIARSPDGHRLFLTALMVASKSISDVSYSNISWVAVGQNLFTLRVLNQMERVMVGHLDFKVNISKEDYEQFRNQVRQIYSQPPPYHSGVTVILDHGVGGKPITRT